MILRNVKTVDHTHLMTCSKTSGAKPFVNGSTLIALVPICLITTSPSFVLSLTTRYLISICSEPIDLLLFFE